MKIKLSVFLVALAFTLSAFSVTAFSNPLYGVWAAKIGDDPGSRHYTVELKNDGTCTFSFFVEQSSFILGAQGTYSISGTDVKLVLNYVDIDETTIPFTQKSKTMEIGLTFSNNTLSIFDYELNQNIALQQTEKYDTNEPLKPNDTNEPAKANPTSSIEAFPEHYHQIESELIYHDGESRYYSYGDDFKALIINGSLINAEIITINNRTLAPVRVVGEYLNFNVDWNPSNKKITLTNKDTKIEMVISSNTVKVNNKNTYTDVPPAIYRNTTYVPVRLISETIGADVAYYSDYDDKMIVFGVPNIIIEYMEPGLKTVSKDDAISKTHTNINASIQKFKATLTSKFKDNQFNTLNNVCSYFKDADGVKYYGEISRYYVFKFGQSRKLFFDKHTSNLYYEGGFSAHSTLNKLDVNSKESFVEFFSEHFTQ